jgi:hypothetical protein
LTCAKFLPLQQLGTQAVGVTVTAFTRVDKKNVCHLIRSLHLLGSRPDDDFVPGSIGGQGDGVLDGRGDPVD